MTNSQVVPNVPTPTSPTRVFICYRREYDKHIADYICQLLASYDVVIDKEETPGLSDWHRTLRESLADSKCLIVICTPHMAARKSDPDYAYAEFEWWLSNKDSAPVLVIPQQLASSGNHFVPTPIRDKWPNATPIEIPQSTDPDDQRSRFQDHFTRAIDAHSATTLKTQIDRLTEQNSEILRTSTWLRAAMSTLAILAIALISISSYVVVLYNDSQRARERETTRARTFEAIVINQSNRLDGMETEALTDAIAIASQFDSATPPPIDVFRVVPDTLSSHRRAHRICGEGGAVMTFAVSPCQQWIVAIHGDGQTRLYPSDGRGPPISFPGHDDCKLRPRFYVDQLSGLFFVTAGRYPEPNSNSYEVRARQVPSGRVLTRFVLNGFLYESPRFHTSFRQFVTLTHDGVLRRHSIDGKQVRENRHGFETVTFTALSPTAESYAVKGRRNGKDGMYRWKLVANSELLMKAILGGDLVWTGYSQDGSRLVTATYSNAPRLWDEKSGKRLGELNMERLPGKRLGPPDTNRFRSAFVFSPCGNYVAADSKRPDAVNIWAPVTGELVHRIVISGEGLQNIAFSPDGKYLAAVDSYGGIKVWETKFWTPMHEFNYSPRPRTADSPRVERTNDDTPCSHIEFVGTRFPEVVATRRAGGLTHFKGRGELAEHVLVDDRVNGEPICATMSDDGVFLASVHNLKQQATLAVWNCISGELHRSYDLPGGGVHNETLAAPFAATFIDSRKVAVANCMGHIFHVNLDETSAMRAVSDYKVGLNECNGVALNGDGSRLLTLHRNNFTSRDLVKQGKVAITYDLDSIEMIVSADTGGGGTAFAVASNTRPFASLFPEGKSKKAIGLDAHHRAVRTISFSRDGKHLATGCDGGMVRLWSAASGELLAELVQSYRPIMFLCFSPNGKWIVSVGGNNDSNGRDEYSALLWHVPTRELAARLTGHREPYSVRHAGFSLDSRTVFTVCEDGAVRVFRIGLSDLMQAARHSLESVSEKNTAASPRVAAP